MDMVRIELFLGVCEKGSFSAVAKERFLSSQAVKKHVDALEREVGAKLFERSNQGVHLTEAGRAYRSYAIKMQLLAEEAASEAKRVADFDRRKFKLGVSRNMTMHLLPAVLPSFCAAHPDVDVELVDMPSMQEAEKMLRSGAIHATMTIGNEGADSDEIRYLTIARQAPLVSIDSHSRLAQRDCIGIHDLDGMTLVVTPSSSMRWMVPLYEKLLSNKSLRVVESPGNESGLVLMNQPNSAGLGPAIVIPKWKQRVSVPFAVPEGVDKLMSIDLATNRPNDLFVRDFLARSQVACKAMK